ncbi:unnamed protein product, partial [Mesorhabditis belari]|uniref:VWFA domain-containing protein n=1 Tax=Mesorhabditis belari TaxID=2138241 RepID=A0AAF3EN44_9BILA
MLCVNGGLDLNENRVQNVANALVEAPSSTTSLPNPQRESQCPCNRLTAYNDIVLIIESTDDVKKENFDKWVSFGKETLAEMSIGLDAETEQQLGVLTYDGQVHEVAGLKTYRSKSEMLKADWAFSGGSGSNLAGAIDKGEDYLSTSSPDQRPTSRKVMLIFASTYYQDPNELDSPIDSARNFKENDGIIIVVGFGGLHGEVNATLRQVASAGYFLQIAALGANEDDDAVAKETIIQLLCAANCFCPGDFDDNTNKFVGASFSPLGIPNGGCFWDSTISPSLPIPDDDKTCAVLRYDQYQAVK